MDSDPETNAQTCVCRFACYYPCRGFHLLCECCSVICFMEVKACGGKCALSVFVCKRVFVLSQALWPSCHAAMALRGHTVKQTDRLTFQSRCLYWPTMDAPNTYSHSIPCGKQSHAERKERCLSYVVYCSFNILPYVPLAKLRPCQSFLPRTVSF